MTARRLIASTVAITAAAVCPTAGANMVCGFGCFVTGASTAYCTSATSQLTMEAAEAGAQQVLFLFRNVGTSPMSLTDIYFDDGKLLGVSSIVNYNDPGSIDSNPGRPGTMSNGVGPGERIGVLFDL